MIGEKKTLLLLLLGATSPEKIKALKTCKLMNCIDLFDDAAGVIDTVSLGAIPFIQTENGCR